MLLVGRVDKPHGLRGEVIVSLSTNRDERVAPGAVLVLDGDGGRALTVLHSQPYQHRWLVAFDGVLSREASDAIAHRDLYAEPIDDPDALWVHDLIGRALIDQHGTNHGLVKEVLSNPASDLMVLENKKLVPLTFVTTTDDASVFVDVPDGLFDEQ